MRPASPPALALTMEGLEVVEVVMNERHHYGRLFTELWQGGEGFTLVEHDIVPWPGAIAELEACPNECCAFEYPNGIIHAEPRSGWCVSLGCIKFATSLLARVPCDGEWQNRGWDELDGAVFATLQGEVEVHVHGPPVAHVKARTLVLRREEKP
jgi:hypothetical protein